MVAIVEGKSTVNGEQASPFTRACQPYRVRYTVVMKHLLIVFHSQSGNTASLAEAVYQGALKEQAEVETRLVRAFDAGLDDLLWCD